MNTTNPSSKLSSSTSIAMLSSSELPIIAFTGEESDYDCSVSYVNIIKDHKDGEFITSNGKTFPFAVPVCWNVDGISKLPEKSVELSENYFKSITRAVVPDCICWCWNDEDPSEKQLEIITRLDCNTQRFIARSDNQYDHAVAASTDELQQLQTLTL